MIPSSPSPSFLSPPPSPLPPPPSCLPPPPSSSPSSLSPPPSPLRCPCVLQDRFTELKLQWKSALKKTRKLLLKCPNYEVSIQEEITSTKHLSFLFSPLPYSFPILFSSSSPSLPPSLPLQQCQFECGTVGGMQYHYLRCTGKSPLFKCSQCSRKYESRTGLKYHIASTHVAPPIRPQRTAALSAKSGILIASSPPPLKQEIQMVTPSYGKRGGRSGSTSSSSLQRQHIPAETQSPLNINPILLEPPTFASRQLRMELTPVCKVFSKGAEDQEQLGESVGKTTPTEPDGKLVGEEGMEGDVFLGSEAMLEEGEGGGGGSKRSGKYINIPSNRYPVSE